MGMRAPVAGFLSIEPVIHGIAVLVGLSDFPQDPAGDPGGDHICRYRMLHNASGADDRVVADDRPGENG